MWYSIYLGDTSLASCRTSVCVSPRPRWSTYCQFCPTSGFVTWPGSSHHPSESCWNTESQLKFPELDGTVSKHSVLASSHILFCSEYCSKSCKFDSSPKFFTALKQISSAFWERAGSLAAPPEHTVLVYMNAVCLSWPLRKLGQLWVTLAGVMCLYVRVKFGLQSSFIESFMEILCSHYAQIFTFGWEDSPPSISLVVFFFLLYVISTRRGQKVLCIMPCELKNNVQVFNWYFS